MVLRYLPFALSLGFLSWMLGLIVTGMIRNTIFYQRHLAHLNFIRSERLNRLLGIGVVRWAVKNTPLRIFNPKLAIKGLPDREGLALLRAEMTAAEVGHLVGFVAILPFAVWKFLQSGPAFGLTTLLVNILMNLYPSLLQQWNKRRLDRMLERQ